MISERTLKKWRRDALLFVYNPAMAAPGEEDSAVQILAARILKLTQELMDQHLLKGKK